MASLGPAVTSLRSSLALLESSISILDDGVNDFPRLCKVLQTQQHFELMPESRLHAAQQSLVDEIAPAVEQLLSTAEAYIEQAERKEQSLKARYELLEGRMGHNTRASSQGLGIKMKQFGNNSTALMSETKMLEAKRAQQKKERLQYAIERLELQSKQRERELRKSMAFVRD